MLVTSDKILRTTVIGSLVDTKQNTIIIYLQLTNHLIMHLTPCAVKHDVKATYPVHIGDQFSQTLYFIFKRYWAILMSKN